MSRALQVHDKDGRLASVQRRLRSRGFLVSAVQQRSVVEEGYLVVMPEELQLWYVYAMRTPTRTSGAPAVNRTDSTFNDESPPCDTSEGPDVGFDELAGLDSDGELI